MRWCEGPIWFGDGRYLLWSDIPNNRILRWDEETGAVTVFRKPADFANGNTRDRQGRLLTCEHGTRRVSRTEYDGTITTVADKFDGKPLNSPNDIVCKSDGSIWFTDPPFGILGFYEGYVAKPELPTNVYRVDRRNGQLTVVAGDVNRPNGLAFSPDESKLYVVEAGTTPRIDPRLRRRRRRHAAHEQAEADRRRPGHAGRHASATWTATSGSAGAWAPTALDGVAIFNPDGKQIGRIDLPERCANLCFGGTYRNRLFMCGSTVDLLALREHPGRGRGLNRPRAGGARPARPIRNRRTSGPERTSEGANAPAPTPSPDTTPGRSARRKAVWRGAGRGPKRSVARSRPGRRSVSCPLWRAFRAPPGGGYSPHGPPK